MITKYTGLTLRYLKASRKRTILTIIGIILSVALISSIGLFFKGMQDAEIDSMKSTYGAYHLMFNKVDDKLLSEIADNPKVSRYGFFKTDKEIKINDNLSIDEMEASDKALELFPFKIKSGRLPENNGEAAIEEWVIDTAFKGTKPGDKIEIQGKQYTLTGILENNIETQRAKKGILLSKNNNINGANAKLLVEISSKTNLETAVNELEQLGPKGSVTENKYLLAVEGAMGDNSSFSGLYTTIGIIISIVLISTIAVIYNSFQISVVERMKQFGLLRAVGATPRQIRNIVLREATILAVIGVPIGLIFGVIAIFGIDIVFKLIGGSSVIFIKPEVSPVILLISAAVGLISIYLSALLPAIFAGRISPLVAISSRLAITKEKIKRRKSRFTQKIFGFEASMALKNIKRNRKRYRITVFSIVISIVLFITFNSFMGMVLNVTPPPNESKNIHFTIYNNGIGGVDENIIYAVKNLKYVDKVYGQYTSYGIYSAMNRECEVKQVKDINGIYKESNIKGVPETILNSSIVTYDREAMNAAKNYLEAGSIDIHKMNKENGVILINKSTILNGKTKMKYEGPAANLRVGDEIDIQYTGEDDKEADFKNGNTKKVKILAILKDDPFEYSGNQAGLKLIATPEVTEALTGIKDIKPYGLNIKLKDVKDEASAKAAIESIIEGKSNISLVDNIDQNRRTKSSELMVQILLYGFVIVVSLIGSVNIINTITTNIILRKREFAALKSIGLTQKGLRKMIVLEGLLYSIFGTIYGSIIGAGLSYLMYRGFGGIREFPWSVPWTAIGIAAGAALVIGYISVLSPLSRIKKDNIIETIREDF